jgi:uncharacterized damage-inducible protein DinB
MTTQYLLRLFQSDLWSNEVAIASIAALEAFGKPVPERAVMLMGHVIIAHEGWRKRILGEDVSGMNWMPMNSPAQMKQDAIASFNTWTQTLTGKSDAELHTPLRVKRGEQILEMTLADICTHLLTHSHYHRGQIAALVRQAGGEPANTGFLGFILR